MQRFNAFFFENEISRSRTRRRPITIGGQEFPLRLEAGEEAAAALEDAVLVCHEAIIELAKEVERLGKAVYGSRY